MAVDRETWKRTLEQVKTHEGLWRQQKKNIVCVFISTVPNLGCPPPCGFEMPLLGLQDMPKFLNFTVKLI